MIHLLQCYHIYNKKKLKQKVLLYIFQYFAIISSFLYKKIKSFGNYTHNFHEKCDTNKEQKNNKSSQVLNEKGTLAE